MTDEELRLYKEKDSEELANKYGDRIGKVCIINLEFYVKVY